ncbi:MAG TPA: hypothetical protein VMT68_10280 [Caulobacteraceae bacterium]|nr:hypothetical protein [Caulobacteraceae bacterium]
MRIAIDFDLYKTDPFGFTEPSWTTIHDFLNLRTLAEPTYFPAAGRLGFSPPANAQFGVWSSASMYLGKETSGKYYIAEDVEFPEQGRWVGIESPVGLFFDSSSATEPFLILYAFRVYSQKLDLEHGKGKLDNKGPAPVDRWVEWYPYSG